jgi:hypothetical protein
MSDFIIECVWWLLASPILISQRLLGIARDARFWRIAYSPAIPCASCRRPISLVGIWQCPSCRFSYRGHVLRECPICGMMPRMVRCYECGMTTLLPKLCD